MLWRMLSPEEGATARGCKAGGESRWHAKAEPHTFLWHMTLGKMLFVHAGMEPCIMTYAGTAYYCYGTHNTCTMIAAHLDARHCTPIRLPLT